MKQKLIGLLTALIALARVDPEEQKIIKAQKAEIDKLKAEIDTFHGDHEINDPEVLKLIDEATEVLGRAVPDDEDVNNEPTNIETPAEDPELTDGETVEDLTKANTADELKAIAEDEGVDITGKTTKNDIAQAIVDARSAK